MATVYATVQVVVVMDQAGDYAVGTDDDSAADSYRETIQDPDGQLGMRLIRLAIKVPLPLPIELTGEVSADETATALTVG